MRFGSSQTFRTQLDTVFSRFDFSKVIILDLQLHYFNSGSVNQRMSHEPNYGKCTRQSHL